MTNARRRRRRAARPHFRVGALYELMQQHRLTETTFARRIGVRRRAVGAWLQGVEPSFADVLAMADEFELPLLFFVQPAVTAAP